MPERKDGNKLKKIMNDPSNIVEEMLEGLVKSYPELVHRVESSRVVAKNQKAEQVGLVSGGGSGHEPSHAGFVGEGMLSAAVLGVCLLLQLQIRFRRLLRKRIVEKEFY